MSVRFEDTHVVREGRYALGRDNQTHGYYLSIPVANQMIDYEEYYRLSEAQYRAMKTDHDKANAFAEACRRRQHDDQLILQPGRDRGTAL